MTAKGADPGHRELNVTTGRPRPLLQATPPPAPEDLALIQRCYDSFFIYLLITLIVTDYNNNYFYYYTFIINLLLLLYPRSYMNTNRRNYTEISVGLNQLLSFMLQYII